MRFVLPAACLVFAACSDADSELSALRQEISALRTEQSAATESFRKQLETQAAARTESTRPPESAALPPLGAETHLVASGDLCWVVRSTPDRITRIAVYRKSDQRPMILTDVRNITYDLMVDESQHEGESIRSMAAAVKERIQEKTSGKEPAAPFRLADPLSEARADLADGTVTIWTDHFRSFKLPHVGEVESFEWTKEGLRMTLKDGTRRTLMRGSWKLKE